MRDLRMNIHLFDFVDNYYSELKKLNVLTTSKWTKHDKTSIESTHPPKDNIYIYIERERERESWVLIVIIYIYI